MKSWYKAILFLPLVASPLLAAPKKTASTPVLQSPSVGEIKSGIGVKFNEDRSGFQAPGPISKDFANLPVDRSIIFTAGGRWPNVAQISHCWINPEEGGDIVADLQNWLSAEYRKVGIGFQWNGKCSQTNQPNQIRTYFKRTHTWNTNGGISGGGGLSYLGPVNAQLGGVEGPGTMNVQIAKDIAGYPNNNWKSWVVNVTRATATHEFGHALGLAHEQERNDAPACGDQRGTLPNSGAYLFVGAYDQFSIMNYCKNPANVSSLSEGDLQGLKTLYPNGGTTTPPPPTTTPPPPVAVAGSYNIRIRANNKCMDGNAWGQANGTRLIAWDCGNQQANQLYLARGVGNGQWELKNVHANKCVDIPGSSKDNGARLQLWDCNNTNAQRFTMQDAGGGWVRLVNVNSGKCLDLDMAGGYLQQWDCGGEANKQFGFFKIGASEPSGAGL